MAPTENNTGIKGLFYKADLKAREYICEVLKAKCKCYSEARVKLIFASHSHCQEPINLITGEAMLDPVQH